MSVLRTPRLLLISATAESLSAELVSPAALGEVLSVDLSASWPPELYDADAVRWTLAWLAQHPAEAEWSLYYIAEVPHARAARALLVGVGGYKGGPDAAGVVEIGYGIVPEARRRGFASEAVRGMLAQAFADARVNTVVAHTLSELTPSLGVLRVTGFVLDGPGNDPHEPAAIRFSLTRERYEQLVVEQSTASLPGETRPPSPTIT
jgi:ribosomal-protein-alanine N-acetyltransferase